MKKPIVAAALNFFFMGPGYIYNGKRALLGVGWTITAILLTIVEQAPIFANGQGLQQVSPTAFGMMFVAVFLGNTMFAIDGFREAKAINEGK
jgi:hypothetical protein